MGFAQSQKDEGVYFRNKNIFLVYVDDAILASASEAEIDKIISELKGRFDMTDEGEWDYYLGVNINHQTDGSIELSQPHLINDILKDIHLASKTKPVYLPACSTKESLKRHLDKPKHIASWNHRSVIGKLNYLEMSSRPQIAYAVHQPARFSDEPREPHTSTVIQVCKYLLGTSDIGIIFKPNQESFNKEMIFVDFGTLRQHLLTLTQPDPEKDM